MKMLQWLLEKRKTEGAMLQRELDTFLTVAERGSFLSASKALFLTPASVMHQIDKLEASPGGEAFITGCPTWLSGPLAVQTKRLPRPAPKECSASLGLSGFS